MAKIVQPAQPLTQPILSDRLAYIQSVIMSCRANLHSYHILNEAINTNLKSLVELAAYGYFKDVIANYWFTLVTQVDKLYAQSWTQRISFHKLIDLLRVGIDTDLSQRLNAAYIHRLRIGLPDPWSLTNLNGKLDGLLARITDPQLKPLLDKVKACRDTVTAHTDPQASGDAPTFDELEQLITLADDLFNEIRTAFGFGAMDTLIHGSDPRGVLGLMALGLKWGKASEALAYQDLHLEKELTKQYGVDFSK